MRVPGAGIGVALALLAPAAAHAQDHRGDEGAGDDVIVTAQRRAQASRDVPISLTVLDGGELEQQAALNLDRIGAQVPNLYLARNFGTTSGALVFMRGVGEGDSIFTNDPPVGIYLDDVLLPRSTGAMLDLSDIDRIEVLRGPQGTLYGRNTSGGAIRIITRRPDPAHADAMADATIGSFGRIDVRGAANAPLSDRAALRVSLLSRTQRGWGRNLTDGARVNGQDVQAARASLLWDMPAGGSAQLSADYSDERSAPRFPQQFAPDPATPGRYLNRFVAPDGSIDNFRSADTNPLNDTLTGGASLRLSWPLGDGTLTAISGYRALRSQIGFDQTANASGIGANIILLQDQRQHSFSHELQYAGTLAGGRVDYVAGLFHFTEHNDQMTAISGAVPAGSPAARFLTGDFFAAPSRSGGDLGNWSPYRPQLDTRSLSAFATVTARVARRLNLSAGLRFTDEVKRYDVRFLTAPGETLILPDGTEAHRRIRQGWRDLSPRLAIDYTLERGDLRALLYASAAKGFRSGSFDGRARNIDFVLHRQGAIAPETLWSYEGGVKAGALGGRLTANVDYFVNDYTNIAFSAARANLSPPEIFRQNVGDARIAGLEADISVRPVRGVEVGGWLATLDDRITRLAASPGCTAFVADERRLDLRFTPARRFAGRASFEHRTRLGRFRIGGDYTGSSPYSIALCNEPQHRVDNMEQLNAQFGWDSVRGGWSVIVAGTNLTDRRWNTGSVGVIGYPAEPRQINLTVRRRW